MSAEKRIGFYWGAKEFSIVEARDNTPTIICRGAYENDTSDTFGGGEPAKDIRTVALIQKVLRDNRIEAKHVSVAAPNNESMIRSFVLPTMSESEMSKVIEFEIKKYIPFPLDQITYVHHAFSFNDKSIKKVRIVLAAIRKEILFQYTRALEQAGLSVLCAEPAVVSLTRVLMFKKEIRMDQKVVVVILEHGQGQVIFIQKGVCQFVRDFSLMPSTSGQAPDEQLIKQKLLNEIHMSMDFYSRQYDEEKIEQVLVLSAYTDGQLVSDLATDFGIAVKHVTPVQLLNSPAVDVQSIYAYGAAMAIDPSIKSPFNFTKKQARSDHPLTANIDWSLFERVSKTAAICSIVFVLGWGASFLKIRQLKQEASYLAQRQENFMDISAEEILAKVSKNNRKLGEYQKVRLSSELASILVRAPQLFSEGAWLKDMSIKYTSASKDGYLTMVMEISGYVSLDDPNKEIRMVNDLTAKIKNHEVLGKYFKHVTINSVERQAYQDRTVTVFTMSCS